MSGALLSIDTTPVGVGLGVVPVHEVVSPDSDSDADSDAVPEDSDASASPVFDGSELVKFNDGQHSGRSSEHPTRGTSREPPSGKVMIVNCAIPHLPQD